MTNVQEGSLITYYLSFSVNDHLMFSTSSYYLYLHGSSSLDFKVV